MIPLANVSSYLEDLYTPVTGERTATNLEVIGAIPPEISGMFVQNNPNPRFAPEGLHHWFDGDGMVHGLHLHEGRATYRNRYVETAGLAAEIEAGGPLWRGILNPIDLASGRGYDKDTANTDLVWHNGKLIALWWLGGTPIELTTPGLQTVGPMDFEGTLLCNVAAHPKVDPRTNELVFFDYNPYERPYLQVGVADASGRVVQHTVVDIPEPSLFHDIAITENYTVLMDFPMVWDPRKLKEGKRRVRFHRDRPARFGLLNRRQGGDVRWFETPPCYSYHTINAWESTDSQGNTVVTLLGCRIEDPIPTVPHDAEPEIPRLYFLRLHPFLTRWTFNLGTGAVTEEQLDDTPTEFPRMNDAFLGVRSRLAWTPRIARAPTLCFDGCLRYDTDTGEQTFHHWGEDRYGGETVFVPRPGGTAEDDGWITTFVNDRKAGTTELVILDAQDMSRPPVARVCIPHRVPMGFHAHWAPCMPETGGN